MEERERGSLVDWEESTEVKRHGMEAAQRLVRAKSLQNAPLARASLFEAARKIEQSRREQAPTPVPPQRPARARSPRPARTRATRRVVQRGSPSDDPSESPLAGKHFAGVAT
jgi:hypothetical protein